MQGGLRIRPLLGILQESHLHEAFLVFLGTTLPHVTVRLFQLRARHSLFLLIPSVQCLAGRREKLVVEADDARLASPVRVERTFFDAETPVVPQSCEDFPVSASPAVDALLDVAHNQAAFLLRQTLLQEQVEVFPLHARSILKLVNHHRIDGGADFLVDKRSVAFPNQAVKQGVGVRQQETVVRLILQPHLLVDVRQQPQVVQVTQREVARIEQQAVLRTPVFRFLQQRHQFRGRQGADFVAMGGSLRGPVLFTFQTLLHGCIADVAAQFSVGQFVEITADAPRTVFQVRRRQPVHFEQSRKLVAESLHKLQHLFADVFQFLPIRRDELRVGQFPAQSFSFLDIVLIEDVLSETLDILRHIPAPVVRNPFLDVLQQPVEHRRAAVQFFNHGIHGIAQHLRIVQFDGQVGPQLQFPCQVAHHRLEKRVDGFDAETAVVMNHVPQGLACRLPDFFDRLGRGFLYFLQVTVRPLVGCGNAIQLFQDTFLHFRRGLVGECHRQNSPVRIRVFNQLSYIMYGQRESLAGTGRRLVD